MDAQKNEMILKVDISKSKIEIVVENDEIEKIAHRFMRLKTDQELWYKDLNVVIAKVQDHTKIVTDNYENLLDLLSLTQESMRILI